MPSKQDLSSFEIVASPSCLHFTVAGVRQADDRKLAEPLQYVIDIERFRTANAHRGAQPCSAVRATSLRFALASSPRFFGVQSFADSTSAIRLLVSTSVRPPSSRSFNLPSSEKRYREAGDTPAI